MIATRQTPNESNMLLPTMLRYVALGCCDRLAGALEETLRKTRQQLEGSDNVSKQKV